MLPTDNPIIPPSIEPLEELSEILARGALRLFLKRREKEIKKEFTVTKSLMFTRKISVKPLPSQSATDDSIEQKPSIEEKSTTPSKPLQKMVAFQQLDSKKGVKPLKIHKKPSKLIVKPKIPKTISPDSKSIKSIKH